MLTKVLCFAFLLVVSISLVSTQSCAKENLDFPCVNKTIINVSLLICPSNMTCIQSQKHPEGRCCDLKDIVNAVTTKPATKAPTTNCQDKVNPATGTSDCAARQAYCQKPEYYDLMNEECPKTCNRCGGNNTSTCQDGTNPRTGTSDCPQRKNLCSDPVYYDVMTRQCPKTCGRC